MIEPIKYFIEHQEIFGVAGSVFSGGMLYYMVVMAAKIVRIEENLKSRGSLFMRDPVDSKVDSLDSDIDLDLEGNMIGHSKANGYKMKVDIRGKEGPALLIWTARQKEEGWTIDTILLINKTNGDSVYLEPRENLSNFYTPPLISHNP